MIDLRRKSSKVATNFFQSKQVPEEQTVEAPAETTADSSADSPAEETTPESASEETTETEAPQDSQPVTTSEISDLAYYNKYCQIDNTCQFGGICSGTYNNGAFYFYPTFNYKGCQCEALSNNTEEGEPPKFYAALNTGVTESVREEISKQYESKDNQTLVRP